MPIPRTLRQSFVPRQGALELHGDAILAGRAAIVRGGGLLQAIERIAQRREFEIRPERLRRWRDERLRRISRKLHRPLAELPVALLDVRARLLRELRHL